MFSLVILNIFSTYAYPVIQSHTDGIPIDDARFSAAFPNEDRIPVFDAEKLTGTTWLLYSTVDITYRQYSSPHMKNGDPTSSTSPPPTTTPTTPFTTPKTSAEDILRSLNNLLADNTDPILHDHRVNECQLAARALSDSHQSGIAKTIIGTANYFVALGLAFTHVANGEFNNRTGHSLAFGILWTGLLVIVWLSAMGGSFVAKRSSRTVLSTLQRNFDRLEEASVVRRRQQRRKGSARVEEDDEEREDMEVVQSAPIFFFHLLKGEDAPGAYKALECMGREEEENVPPRGVFGASSGDGYGCCILD
ncbi:hypothetical protein G7Y89_g12464 [Cudoniella acicularis]|uniref:Uncharacterized protein n=1 Tax=Cudoniella acicularis TaxID=354080 RepID=A0A8H4RAD3_9HELO|nr:hypothetical protein G7Y89_g12464 [Cudoniella acicularis]